MLWPSTAFSSFSSRLDHVLPLESEESRRESEVDFVVNSCVHGQATKQHVRIQWELQAVNMHTGGSYGYFSLTEATVKFGSPLSD